tara:strand:- start:184 stop:441 length:258 start_codon:yes stop_codon:yes gene_type:complete
MKVIKFYADWCGPCQTYKSQWNKVVEELKDGEIEFLDINVDKDTTGLAAKFNVKSIPHTVRVIDEEVKTKTGLLTSKELKSFILE